MTEPAVTTSEPGADRKLGHVLVVDDNRINRLKLSRALTQRGHTVSEAEMAAWRWKCCAPSSSIWCCSTS